MDSRQFILVTLAARVQPKILPKQATQMTRRTMAQLMGSSKEPIEVRRPERAKYKGRNKMATMSSSFSVMW